MPSRPLVGNERAGGNPGAGRRCRGSQSPLQALGARRALCCGMQEALLEEQMTPLKGWQQESAPLQRVCSNPSAIKRWQCCCASPGSGAGSNPGAIAAVPSRFTWSSTQPSLRDQTPLPARALLVARCSKSSVTSERECGLWGQQLSALAWLGRCKRGLWLHNNGLGTNLKRFGLPL